MDNYSFTKKCSNCERKNYLSIKKGVTVKGFLEQENIKCDFCGCELE